MKGVIMTVDGSCICKFYPQKDFTLVRSAGANLVEEWKLCITINVTTILPPNSLLPEENM